MLTIESEKLNLEEIIIKGVSILPLGENLFKVGATNTWYNLDEIASEQGKNELCEKLDKILKVPYKIIEHKAGIRPTVKDRRPLIGLHPRYPSVAIFNGLGTKGVMIAPYFANEFVNFLEGIHGLSKEVDINRFTPV